MTIEGLKDRLIKDKESVLNRLDELGKRESALFKSTIDNTPEGIAFNSTSLETFIYNVQRIKLQHAELRGELMYIKLLLNNLEVSK